MCLSLLTLFGDPLPLQPGLSERWFAAFVSWSTHSAGGWELWASHLTQLALGNSIISPTP